MYNNTGVIKIHITKPSLILSTGDLYVCTVYKYLTSFCGSDQLFDSRSLAYAVEG